jgi:hypothetical protein
MKQFLTVMTLVALASCKQPAGVELKTVDPEPGLNVTSIAVADTSMELTPIDSSAVLPDDQIRFEGLIQITSITYNAGSGIRTFAFSRVFFADRNRPIRYSLFGGRIGYFGSDLNGVTLNGNPMTRVAHRIPLRFTQRDTVAGFEYREDVSTTYRPNTVYSWATSPIGMGIIAASIKSPDSLIVYSPAGGSVVPKNRNLQLRWSGQGELSIIISYVSPTTKPLLQIRPLVNRGSAVLGTKLLRLLPGGRKYWFTFILSNRDDSRIVNQSKILVQAASAYNCMIELR